MVKVIEVKAPLETLNRIEATGLPTKWVPDKDVLEVTINDETDDDLRKLITALSETTKKFTLKCTKIEGYTVEEIHEVLNRG